MAWQLPNLLQAFHILFNFPTPNCVRRALKSQEISNQNNCSWPKASCRSCLSTYTCNLSLQISTVYFSLMEDLLSFMCSWYWSPTIVDLVNPKEIVMLETGSELFFRRHCFWCEFCYALIIERSRDLLIASVFFFKKLGVSSVTRIGWNLPTPLSLKKNLVFQRSS